MSDESNTQTPAPPVSIVTFVAHRRMVLCLFLSTVVLVLWLSHSLQGSDPSALKAVAMCGALGGFFSALRRFYSFDSALQATPAVWVLGNSPVYLIVYSLIPPLIGAIGAGVIYVVMAGQMIKAGILPNFANIPDNPHTVSTHFYAFINDWKPEMPTDYAKVLVLGFIAGFSERFVPDILQKLTDQADKAS
jgi:hypothetical protein